MAQRKDNMLFGILVSAIAALFNCGYCLQTELSEYCLLDTFRPRCPSGEMIMVTSANYGRMKVGSCVPVSFGHIGCHTNVLSIVDDSCSGRQNCDFEVWNLDERDDLSPCPEGLKMYLEASYRCVNVVSAPSIQCSETTHLTEASGYISSFAARQECGDRKTSWMIKSSPGQQVNISLIDFGYDVENEKKKCFGNIIEEGHKSNATICRQHGQKEQHVYTSNGRNVGIDLAKRSGSSEYLIYYKVYGCADMDVPVGAWYKREGDIAIIGCESEESSWRLQCEGTEWTGIIGSCPVENMSPVREAQSSSSWINVENDFTMLILVCIGVGFVILIAICVALIIIKLRRRDPPPASTMLLDADYRKSVIEPFPPMAQDSGHYRSLVKSRQQPGYPDPQCSSSGPPSHFPQLSDGNVSSHPLQATDNRTQFSTIQSTGQRASSREEGAPDYFVLDKQFC